VISALRPREPPSSLLTLNVKELMWLLSTIMSTVEVLPEASSFAQRSPRQIAWRRLKRNKVALVSACIAIFFIVLAFGAPLITKIFGVDNTTIYPTTIGPDGLPKGAWGGVSWHHPLEWNHKLAEISLVF